MSDHSYSPMTSGMDGGYFATPVPAQAASYPPTAYPAGPGYGTAPSFTGGASSAGATGTLDDVPAWLVVVATVLVLMGLAAGWVGVTLVVTTNALGAWGGGEGVLVRALLLLANAGLNAWLAYQLLRGWGPARWPVSAVCVWWVLYWLYQTSKVGDLGRVSEFGLGGMEQVAGMMVLGLLLLAGLAAATAALVWSPSASRHLTQR